MNIVDFVAIIRILANDISGEYSPQVLPYYAFIVVDKWYWLVFSLQIWDVQSEEAKKYSLAKSAPKTQIYGGFQLYGLIISQLTCYNLNSLIGSNYNIQTGENISTNERTRIYNRSRGLSPGL